MGINVNTTVTHQMAALAYLEAAMAYLEAAMAYPEANEELAGSYN